VERAKFEDTSGPEPIDPDLTSFLRSQSLTDESEADETPINHDRLRKFCHSLAAGYVEIDTIIEGWEG